MIKLCLPKMKIIWQMLRLSEIIPNIAENLFFNLNIEQER
jgi:hypothetical protein